MAKRTRTRVLYTDDTGNQYRVTVAADLAAFTEELGWEPDDNTKPGKPQGLIPRYVLMQTPGGDQTRKFHCGSLTATAYVDPSVTIAEHTWENADFAPTTFVRTGRVGEKLTD